MGDKQQRRRWPGGYIHRQKDGRDLFIIEREVGGRKGERGKRYHVSTRAHSIRAALKHLERFEADPANYRPEGVSVEVEDPVLLTDELVIEFLDWQTKVKRVTRKHAKEVGDRLDHWVEDLHGVDLRKATLRDHIKPALEKRETMRAHRISTIKVFFGWLRKEKHLLISAQDPTLDLPVPQSSPAKWKRRKAVEFDRLEKVLPLLGPIHRDVLMLIAATGWHFTELVRFVSSAESEIRNEKRGNTIAVLVMRHKSGELVRSLVEDRAVLSAAKRLRKSGKIAREFPPGGEKDEMFRIKMGKGNKHEGEILPPRPNQSIAWACKEKRANVPVFTLGQLRASVATWLTERGLTREQVAEFLHHKDPRTTSRYYADVEVPTIPVALPRLRLVKG